MDKLTKTIFLLILIAISMQTYLINGESHSSRTIALAVPLIINTLLIIIYINQTDNSTYKKSIKNLLISCLIISAIYFVLFGYIMQLGKAFKN